MTKQDLKLAFALAQNQLEHFLEGITPEQAQLTVSGKGNPVNWILGHIITSRCNLLAMLDIDPPWDFERCKPYLPDSEPLSIGDEVEDFNVMKDFLDETQRLI